MRWRWFAARIVAQRRTQDHQVAAHALELALQCQRRLILGGNRSIERGNAVVNERLRHDRYYSRSVWQLRSLTVQ